MQGWFNIYVSMNTINNIQRFKIKNYMLLSIDTEKLANKIQHLSSLKS